MQDYFSGENTKPRKEWFKFDKVGDKITGVYIGKVKNDQPDNWGHKNIEYIFKTSEGYVFVSGRNYRKGEVQGPDTYRILYPMLGVKPGTVMGLMYKEDKPSTKGNPFKVIEAIYPDELKNEPEAIEEFNQKMGQFYNLETGQQEEELPEAVEEIVVEDVPFN